MRFLLSTALLGAACVSAQAGPWAQCGGSSYTGPTSCVSEWSCVYLNEWFSHCKPASGTTSSTLTTTTSTTATSTTTTTTRSSGTSTSTGRSTFATTDGLHFSIDGKTTGYIAGTNAYWLPFLTNNADVDSVFDHLQQTGLKVLRTWGFNGVNSIPSPGTRYGIMLIIPFVNNWNDYGGMNVYVNVYGGDKAGWYTNSQIQRVYRAYIAAVVARYKESPAIFAWELGNEPRCQGCSTDVIYNWVKDTSANIKSLDPNHMVTTGEEGMGLTTRSDGSYPYTTYEGSDFSRNIAIPDIDFGTFHLYTTDWGVTNNSWGNGWIESHAAACGTAGKPCVFEEYGMKDSHCTAELEWQDISLATTGMAADLFWQYGQQLSTGNSPDDRYTIYYGTEDWNCAVVDHLSQL
ncbi:glycoside hydrolase superfamily [Aspergillus recurvatus]